MIRKIRKLFRVHAHGKDHLIVCIPQRLDAAVIERLVLIDRSHGDIDRLVRGLFHGGLHGTNGRPDKMIPVRERLAAGLELLRRIDDGVRFVVVLYDIQKTLHRIPLIPQPFDLPVDLRHGQQHLRDIERALFHISRGVAVERERRRGTDVRQPVFHGGEFAPERHGIGDDQVWPDAGDVFRSHLIQRQRSAYEKFRSEGLVLADPGAVLLVFHLEVVAVAGNEMRAGRLDLFPERFERKVPDLVTRLGQFLHQTQRGIRVPVRGDAEPCDLHLCASFPSACVNQKSKVSFGGIAMPRCVSPRRIR